MAQVHVGLGNGQELFISENDEWIMVKEVNQQYDKAIKLCRNTKQGIAGVVYCLDRLLPHTQ